MDSTIAWEGSLLRAKQGDNAALEALLRRYRPFLRVVCDLRMPELCQRREDASDLVQQTLLDATRGVPEFRGATVAEFEVWILRLLDRNLLQSVRRHTAEKRDVRREFAGGAPDDSVQLAWHSLPGDASTPSRSMFRGEAALLLAEALEKLPEGQRIAVELRYLGQHPLDDIARIMGTSKGAVAGLLRRGVEALRDVLPGHLAEVS